MSATVHWAQRAGTVYLTWEYVAAKDVTVTLSDAALSFSATVGDKQLAMADMALGGAIVPAESKWFANDRCARARARARRCAKPPARPARSRALSRRPAELSWAHRALHGSGRRRRAALHRAARAQRGRWRQLDERLRRRAYARVRALAPRRARRAPRRCVQAILKKAKVEWWDKLCADRAFKPFVKPDWSRWVEEDDAEYAGRINGIDFDGAGGDWDDEADSDDDDVPLDDLDVSVPKEPQ